MKISYNWLKEYISLKEKPEKIADILTMHAFEVEDVKRVGKDYIFNLDILPNRAHDCLSHIGVARELGVLLKRKVNFKIPKVKENKKEKIEDYISVDVNEKYLCSRYTARVILNLKVGPSPKWLKERVESLDQKSINNVVDATNYAMFLMGQPMHAFDLDKLKEGEIIVAKSKKDEVIEVLGGDKYILDDSILTIRGKDGLLAIAGIKGGVKAEIDANTKNIILESAYFEPINIRQTSKKLNLRTDSSMRFENELHQTICKDALEFLAGIILDVAGGSVVSGVIDTGVDKYEKTKIIFSIKEIKDVIGIDISEKDILVILKRLGFFVVKSVKKDIFIADVPFERLDVLLKEDLAEEVARVYGYENINSRPIEAELYPAERNDEYFYSDSTKNILVGLGLTDVYNYSFIGRKEIALFNDQYNDLVSILKPLSLDKKFLRPTLLFHLLNNIYENLKHQKHIRLFEIGKVFSYSKSNGLLEKNMLAGVLAYKTKRQDGAEVFYELKGILEIFFEKLGIADISIDALKNDSSYSHSAFWHSGRIAEVSIGNIVVGVVGEISHSILNKMNIDTRVSAFDLDFSKIIKMVDEKYEYKAISKFPATTRDIAILTESDARIGDVQDLIERVGGSLLVDVDLFDIYDDNNTNALFGKSLAFHLIFQSQEKTLLDKDVDSIMERIVKSLKDSGWDVRQ
ncbi:MAG: phenylalanine--tRNA ligase subunit beta [Patescibacteria group bacterium]